MLEVVRFVNSRFTSNTYIIAHPEYENVWVVDPGDTDAIFEWMKAHSKTVVSGILLTHVHFDHIYGMNEIISRYPQCVVFIANDYGREALSNPKTNGSKYTEEGSIIISSNAKISYYTDTMFLWLDVEAQTFNTPGHSDDSQCFIVDGMLFTGDTLIKDVRTVTKLKGGSVDKLNETVMILAELKGRGLKVMPGHEEEFLLDDYDLEKMTRGRLNN
jgi:glyoxylase-like metal-dependent hydrolase (beta-lactamase superfamily II)